MDSALLGVSLLLSLVVADAVEMSSEPRCNRGKSLGNCPGRDPRWVYSVVSGTCQAIPGGCPSSSNFNNFDSRSDCMSACMSSSQATRDAMRIPGGYIQIGRRNRNRDRIQRPDRVVRTRANRRRGNNRRGNNRRTPLPAKCTYEPARGRCRAAFKKWYFNEDTGRCDTFTYGGCGGNDNRFNDEATCQRECGVRNSDK